MNVVKEKKTFNNIFKTFFSRLTDIQTANYLRNHLTNEYSEEKDQNSILNIS